MARLERGLAQDMARIFGDMRSRWEADGEMAAWSPSMNVYEKDDQIVMEAELPGLKKEDIEVSVQDNMLRVSGKRNAEKEIKEENYYRHERRYGAFSRSVSLPSSVDSTKINANYQDGVLKVTIPKAEEAKAKRIEIR